jgi:hypothetical protein
VAGELFEWRRKKICRRDSLRPSRHIFVVCTQAVENRSPECTHEGKAKTPAEYKSVRKGAFVFLGRNPRRAGVGFEQSIARGESLNISKMLNVITLDRPIKSSNKEGFNVVLRYENRIH